MSAPFRIERRTVSDFELISEDEGTKNTTQSTQAFKDYLGRLLKMIPGEIVGLYMIGSGFIPSEQPTVLTIWSVICLILLIIIRVWGTADPVSNKPPQPIPVTISAIAFVIWLYWLDGPFEQYHIHVPYIASLLVLVWSFIIPVIYKGDYN